MLRYVPPPLIKEAWPIILPGLLKVQEHSAEPDLPEQVLPALVRNSAWLYIVYTNGEYTGFVILRPEVLSSGRRNMHIWAAYNSGSNFWGCYSEIEEAAKQFGATSLTITSPRKGWLRRMKDYRPVYIIYRKDLP